MPLQATSGAASQDAFGGGAAAVIPYYIEDMFSCFLYTGNATARSIVNNIDISGNGGLVWTKSRSLTGSDHFFVDTDRGATKFLNSNNPAAQVSTSDITAFNSNGYSLNADVNGGFNNNGATFASWTFRKQPKFFDVVTYTGNGTNGRAISHALGSVPGCIMVKSTSNTSDWIVYHRGLSVPTNRAIFLNTTAAESTSPYFPTTPTSTVFYTNGDGYDVNTTGQTYVAYLFAHDAGGFGLTGTDNVISCGSVVGASQVEVNLGYEPQWILVKNASSAQDWWLVDNMRGLPVQDTSSAYNASNLRPNLSDAETTGFSIAPSATGFKANVLTASQTYIYIAIRRGPMKVPTTGTSVFQPVTYSGNGSNDRLVDTTITPDLFIDMRRDNTMPRYVLDRLRGNGRLYSNLTNAESSNTAQIPANTFNVNQTGVTVSADEVNASGRTFVLEAFRRAPGFFDEVCFTQTTTSSSQAVTHNLTVAPELVITKPRNGEYAWNTFPVALNNRVVLNETTAASTYGPLSSVTSTSFSYPMADLGISIGTTYVAYLFATCAGVSKVGSYTGTGALQTVACGFTSGARFVLIKRTDSSGDWYVWDSARGISSGNDPYLLLNTGAAEVTGTNYVDTDTTGFKVTAAAPAGLNANGGTYIFLAIA